MNKRTLLSFLLLILAVYFFFGFLNVNRRNLPFFEKEFLTLAHRGGKGLYPENTILAFEKAREMGVDVLEIDVHPTKYGKIVVIHDDTVDRTTNGKGKVRELTYEEIEKLDAAYNFSKDGGKTFPFRGKGIKIPLLSQVLSKFNDMRISIEIKESDGNTEEKVLDLIEKYDMEDKVIVASENYEILKKVRELNPKIATSMSEKEVRNFYISFITFVPLNFYKAKGDALMIPTEAEGKNLSTKRFINAAHSKGLKVIYWTINDEEKMRELIKLGVDGIITDYPDKLMRVLKEERER